MFDKYGREVRYIDAGFGWATMHVLGAQSATDGQRAFTLDWRGNAPGGSLAVSIADSMKPEWAVEEEQP